MAIKEEIEDKLVLEVLQACSAENKAPLVEYITDNEKGRISLSSQSFGKLIAARASGNFTSEADRLILEEIQLFGGNSIANLLRFGEGVSYAAVVQDVAVKVKADVRKGTCEEMERAILVKVLEKAWEKMTEDERSKFTTKFTEKAVGVGPAALAAVVAAAKLGGFATYELAAIVANAISRQIIGKGLGFAANATLMGTMGDVLGIMAGPFGWVITGAWLLADVSGPAYRVTVPCILHIAFLRLAINNQKKVCPNQQCNFINDRNAKFCSNCGTPLAHLVASN